MDLYQEIVHFIDVNIVFCLLPCILSLMLISVLFKNGGKAKKALTIIRWFIIGYATITNIQYVIGIILLPEEYAFIQRATGPYMFAYWFMFIGAVAIPFTLLIKKWASNYWYVMLVVILMKSGFYFERFVIIVTSFHRDYLPSRNSILDLEGVLFLGLLFLQGFMLALLLLGIVEVIERRKTRQNIADTNT